MKKYMNIKEQIDFSSNEIVSVLPDEELANRIFIKKSNILDEYIEEIKNSDIKANGKGILDFLKDDSKYVDELFEFKQRIQGELDRLEVCSRCECLKCSIICPFKACRECSSNIKVKACDRSNVFITTGYGDIKLYLNNSEIEYEVVGILYDKTEDKKYIYLSERNNTNNQQILEYKKHLDGSEEFNALPSEDKLDKVYEVFLKFNIIK